MPKADEYIGSIANAAAVGLDEERQEIASCACECLVVTEEETAGIRCADRDRMVRSRATP